LQNNVSARFVGSEQARALELAEVADIKHLAAVGQDLERRARLVRELVQVKGLSRSAVRRRGDRVAR
jgi:hypothetical protein